MGADRLRGLGVNGGEGSQIALGVARRNPTDPLRRRVGTTCTMRARGDQLELLLGDRRLTMPAKVESAIRMILDAGEFTPTDVPRLSADSSLVLCRRLVKEGLLEVVR